MIDRERVIKGLQIERECVSRDCDRNCGECDLVQDRDWLLSVYDDAIALLKELEAVKPVPPEDELGLYRCGKCHHHLIRYVDKYCPRCGKVVKWNA